VQAAAVGRAAATFPKIAIDCVQGVVDEDFFSGGQIAFCEQEPAAMRGIDEAVGIAGVVDVAFRRLHEDDGSVREEVAMALQFSVVGAKRMLRIDNA